MLGSAQSCRIAPRLSWLFMCIPSSTSSSSAVEMIQLYSFYGAGTLGLAPASSLRLLPVKFLLLLISQVYGPSSILNLEKGWESKSR